MARHPNPTAEAVDIEINATDLQQDVRAANELASLVLAQQAGAVTLARELGYEGALTVGALEDEIRFYQRRSVEALLEAGKRLLLLQEVTQRGEFDQRVEMLGFSRRSAYRFMQAASKVAKSANLALLSTQVKNSSAFLELITHDDDVIEGVSQLDDIDRLSASQLRAKVREMKAEVAAKEQRLEVVSQQRDAAEEKAARIAVMPPDQQIADLKKKAVAIAADAEGAILGGLRQALIALQADGTDHGVFMAGLVGQVQARLSALRQEFNLPDVSNAADAELASEVAQWAN
jgi:hypothetical protein